MRIVDLLDDPATGDRLARCRGDSQFVSWGPGAGIRGDDGHGGRRAADLQIFGRLLMGSMPGGLQLLTGGVVISSTETILLATWVPDGLSFDNAPAIDLSWRRSTGRSAFSLLSKDKRTVEVPSIMDLVSILGDDAAMLDLYTEGRGGIYGPIIAEMGLRPTRPRGSGRSTTIEWMREDLARAAA